MAIATLPAQALPDHVFVTFDRQCPNLPPAGTHHLPIGMAYEAIRQGVARIDQRSRTQYDAFSKAQEAAAARHQQRLAARGKELSKAKK